MDRLPFFGAAGDREQVLLHERNIENILQASSNCLSSIQREIQRHISLEFDVNLVVVPKGYFGGPSGSVLGGKQSPVVEHVGGCPTVDNYLLLYSWLSGSHPKFCLTWELCNGHTAGR